MAKAIYKNKKDFKNTKKKSPDLKFSRMKNGEALVNLKNIRKNKKQEKEILPPFGSNFDDSFDSNKEPDINDYYYDALELSGGGAREIKEALKLLNIALEMDKDYVQTYIGFVCVYSAAGDKKRAEGFVKIAYEKTLKKFPKWPKRMEWGYMSNRAYMRAIQYMGDLHWDNGEKEKAIKLFRLLLKLNPGDNQGVRYEIAALYAGLNGEDVNRMTDEGNEKQDWSEQENLVMEQNKKHKFWKAPRY